jgi:hypothetical protein
MFLALLTVLLIDVDHWECLTDDTDAQLHRCDVWWRMNREENGRWMGRGSRRPRADSTGQIRKQSYPVKRDKESESPVTATEYIWYITCFPLFPFDRLPQDLRSCSTPLNDPLKELQCQVLSLSNFLV